MVELLSVDEGAPSSYPTLTTSFDNAVVWRRVEQWIRYRWNERAVTWIVQGPGVWVVPLKPATIDTAEAWDGDDYETVTLTAAPVGYQLDATAYQITATVGDTEAPPADVLEACNRLGDYMTEVQGDAALGFTSASDGDYSFDRSATWAARALQNSGAADLLRGYR